MTTRIHTGGAIEGYGLTIYGPRAGTVQQTATHTVVTVTDDGWQTHRVLSLPHARYALSCDSPASGAPGRADFDRDMQAALT